MNREDESCIQSINRMYCYLRRVGVDPQAACRQLEALMPRIITSGDDINPALIIQGNLDAIDHSGAKAPHPAPTPALLRGHIRYP
jgi:hypothetical protein